MYADDIGTLAFEDRKKPLQNDELKTPTDFIRAFQDKVAAKSQGGGGELMKQFKLFDEEGKGFGEFSTLILRTCLLAYGGSCTRTLSTSYCFCCCLGCFLVAPVSGTHCSHHDCRACCDWMPDLQWSTTTSSSAPGVGISSRPPTSRMP